MHTYMYTYIEFNFYLDKNNVENYKFLIKLILMN